MDTALTDKDVKHIRAALFPAHTHWFDIGLVLDVHHERLVAIRREFSSDVDCLREMLFSRFKIGDPLTWTDLCDSLRDPTVGRNDVANDIEKQVKERQAQNVSQQASVALKHEQVKQLEKLTTQQQQQLEKQYNEISALRQENQTWSSEVKHLSGRLTSLEVQGSMPRPLERTADQPQGLGQREAPVAKPRKSPPQYPTSMSFQWRKCRDIPENKRIDDQPVVLDNQVYVRIKGSSLGTDTVSVYTPDHDMWDELPPPPVYDFTIATLKHQLVVVGGRYKSEYKLSDELIVWDSKRRQWVQQYPPMKQPLEFPLAVEYRELLIVAGGRDSVSSRISEVNILDTTSNMWIAVESLPHADDYRLVLVEDSLVLVGSHRHVLRAHIPTLISQARTPPPSQQSVWKVLPNAIFYCTSPIALDNMLLTIGGSTSYDYHNRHPRNSIQLYNPTNKQWTNVGLLPEPVYDCPSTVLTGTELLLLGGRGRRSIMRSVYVLKVEY